MRVRAEWARVRIVPAALSLLMWPVARAQDSAAPVRAASESSMGDAEFDQALGVFRSDLRDLHDEGLLDAESMDLLLRETLGRFDVLSLSASQVVRLKHANLLSVLEIGEPFIDRLRVLGGGGGADGAAILAYRANLLITQRRRGEAMETMARLLEHEGLADLVRTDDGGEMLQTLGLLAPDMDGTLRARVYEMLASLPEELTLGGAVGLRIALHNLARFVPTELLESHANAIERALVITRRTIAGAHEPRVIRLLAEIESHLNGRAARGELLGRDMPTLDVMWSSRVGNPIAEARGKVLVLVFITTWSQPCHQAFNDVHELRAHYFTNDDVRIVGVTSPQGRILLRQGMMDTGGNHELEASLMPDFMHAFGIAWDLVMTTQPAFNADYGVMAVPHMTIIDRAGRVRFNEIHPSEPIGSITERIDGLLRESPG